MPLFAACLGGGEDRHLESTRLCMHLHDCRRDRPLPSLCMHLLQEHDPLGSPVLPTAFEHVFVETREGSLKQSGCLAAACVAATMPAAAQAPVGAR